MWDNVIGDSTMLYKNNLKRLRENANLNQIEFAKILKIDSKNYSHYENEDLLMPMKYIIAICNYFNVSVDYLLGFTDIKQYSNVNNNVSIKDVGIRIKAWRKSEGITQKAIAIDVNTAQPVITNYENGRTLIATPFLYTICKKYNISADYLLGRIDNPKHLK